MGTKRNKTVRRDADWEEKLKGKNKESIGGGWKNSQGSRETQAVSMEEGER